MRRLALFVLIGGLFGLPLLLPAIELFSQEAWTPWSESTRIIELAMNTAALCALTVLFAMPLGIGLAIVLYRTDLPGARLFQSILAVGLFIPLPVYALAWQSVGGGGWRPWTQDVWFAALVHAAAALPWVVWLTGLGLTRVERELEEDALTSLSPAGVLLRVSLWRAWPAIGLAAVWIIVQTAGEITVTDLAVVRTFAEEVYTQFVVNVRLGLGRAVAIALPMTVAGWLIVGSLVRRWTGRLSVSASAAPPRTWRLGAGRIAMFVVVLAVVAAHSAIPLLSLVRQAGGGGSWSMGRLAVELQRAFSLHAPLVLDSLLWAGVAGVIASALALWASWLAIDSRWHRLFLFAVVIALWAAPGPVLGFGLKEAIELLMDGEDIVLSWTTARPLRAVLYEWSTPLPVLWAHIARFFPYAVAILWPVVRDVPRDLRDMARVDGASSWTEFRRVVWPASRNGFWISTLVVTALSLGELSASKLVQVPGRPTFVQELFSQMHYGSTATTAALAIVLLVPACILCALIGWIRR